MLQSQKDALTHAVRSFKRRAMSRAFLGETSGPSLNLPDLDIEAMDLEDKIQVSRIMLELIEVQDMLPEDFKDSLWDMRQLLHNYKVSQYRKEVVHAS